MKSKAVIALVTIISAVVLVGGAVTATLVYISAKEAVKVEEEEKKEKEEAKKEKEEKEKAKEKEAKEKAKEEERKKEAEKEAAKQAELKVLSARSKRAYSDIIQAYLIGSNELFGVDNIDLAFDSSVSNKYEDEYALYDLNGDGIEELFLFSENTYVANLQLNIFHYDDEQKKAVPMNIALSPYGRLYDNGVYEGDWSHNQTNANEFWPYDLYKYDAESKTFKNIASVEAWERACAEMDYNGNAFPTDVDKDGNGVIYIIYQNEKTTNMDDAEYNEWHEKFIDKASVVNLNRKAFDDSYDELSIEYRQYLDSALKKICEKSEHDLAGDYISYWNGDYNGSFTNSISDYVTFAFEDEYGVENMGSINGVEAVSYFDEDGGELAYFKAVEGVTLFGVKPGDSIEKAEKILKSVGFYKDMNYNYGDVKYRNGLGCCTYGISFKLNGDTIEEIVIYLDSMFAG